jgi:predicted TIM-barrel fold metal-dependent hydrolase
MTDTIRHPRPALIAEPGDRVAEQRAAELRSDITVVSSDNHWSIAEDLFQERLPVSLRRRAPSIVHDAEYGCYDWTLNGASMVPPVTRLSLGNFERRPGSVQVEARLADMDAEGVDMEIAFGNMINVFHHFPDLEVRAAGYRVYNEYMAEIGARAPGRFFGVGVVNFWDPKAAAASVEEVAALGLKAIVLPQAPRGANGEPLSYVSPEMDPLWEAIARSGIPLCFHVGEFYQEGPGGYGISGMQNFGPFRKQMGEFIFGGILDRHPALKIFFCEAELNWIPGALMTADMIYDCSPFMLDPKIAKRPSEYWATNFWASFINDPVGLRLMDEVGVDKALWSLDYPHAESSLSFAWSARDVVIDAFSHEDATKLLGGNAIELFGLPH